MLLLIVFGIMFVLGCWLITTYDHELLGCILTTISVGILIFLIPIFIYVSLGNSNYIIEYNQDKAYLESIKDNNQLTDKEREKAVSIVMETNNTIMKSKKWRNNFIIGIYYCKTIGDMPLFDINKVPKASKKFNIESNRY
jgi:hypothetical protein